MKYQTSSNGIEYGVSITKRREAGKTPFLNIQALGQVARAVPEKVLCMKQHGDRRLAYTFSKLWSGEQKELCSAKKKGTKKPEDADYDTGTCPTSIGVAFAFEGQWEERGA